eukprot:sb/3468871/
MCWLEEQCVTYDLRDNNDQCTTMYSRTPIYRDPRGKGFCPVNRGTRYIGMKYRSFPISGKFIVPVNRGSGISGPGKSGSDCITIVGPGQTSIYRDAQGKGVCPVNRGLAVLTCLSRLSSSFKKRIISAKNIHSQSPIYRTKPYPLSIPVNRAPTVIPFTEGKKTLPLEKWTRHRYNYPSSGPGLGSEKGTGSVHRYKLRSLLSLIKRGLNFSYQQLQRNNTAVFRTQHMFHGIPDEKPSYQLLLI